MLNKIMQIVRREYLETVKTKAFLIGVLILPLFIGVVIVFGGKMQKKAFTGPREDHHLAVLNHETIIDKSIRQAFEDYNQGRF